MFLNTSSRTRHLIHVSEHLISSAQRWPETPFISFTSPRTSLQYLAPEAETGFSHILTAYKIVGHLFGLSYRKISLNNRVKNILFRMSTISVPCLHAQLRGRTVIKKLWTFFGPWGRSRSPPCWIFWFKQIHQSTASGGRHGYLIQSNKKRHNE